jgi:hypothetical protein
MESGAIRDEDITASSSFDSGNVGPQFGRWVDRFFVTVALSSSCSPLLKILTARPEFHPRRLHVRFVVGEVALEKVFLQDYWNNKPSSATDLIEYIKLYIWPYMFRPLMGHPQRHKIKTNQVYTSSWSKNIVYSYKFILRSTTSVKLISFYCHTLEDGSKGSKDVRPYI